MNNEYIKLIIDETARNSLKEDMYIMNTVKERFNSIKELKSFLRLRYGNIPKGRNKIYIDTKQGESKEIGFMHSFWNRDISHNSKSWYQTDWIAISHIKEEYEPIIRKDLNNGK